ncbi:hypothetical protein F5879DRAFT_923560 [Lentinula edodes]|nr:hypothetical protein F5879DRAFT_923560 [Lentinula edodes]
MPNNQAPSFPLDDQHPSFTPNNQPPSFPPNGQPPSFPPNGQPPSFPPNGQSPSFPPNGQPPSFPPNGQPPSFLLNDQPPSFLLNDQPPSFQLNDQPPSFQLNDQPPSFPLNDQPPWFPLNDQPPWFPLNDQPPWFPLNDQPPSFQLNDQPPSFPLNDQPPSFPLNDQPPSFQLNDQPPSFLLNDQPPLFLLNDQPPMLQLNNQPPSFPLNDQPPSFPLNEHSPLFMLNEQSLLLPLQQMTETQRSLLLEDLLQLTSLARPRTATASEVRGSDLHAPPATIPIAPLNSSEASGPLLHPLPSCSHPVSELPSSASRHRRSRRQKSTPIHPPKVIDMSVIRLVNILALNFDDCCLKLSRTHTVSNDLRFTDIPGMLLFDRYTPWRKLRDILIPLGYKRSLNQRWGVLAYAGVRYAGGDCETLTDILTRLGWCQRTWDDKCDMFEWAEDVRNWAWDSNRFEETAIVTGKDYTKHGDLFNHWFRIKLLFDWPGYLTLGLSPSKESTNEVERLAAELTQNTIKTNRVAIKACLVRLHSPTDLLTPPIHTSYFSSQPIPST